MNTDAIYNVSPEPLVVFYYGFGSHDKLEVLKTKVGDTSRPPRVGERESVFPVPSAFEVSSIGSFSSLEDAASELRSEGLTGVSVSDLKSKIWLADTLGSDKAINGRHFMTARLDIY